MMDFEERIARVLELFREADALVVGGGAGLSAAAGLEYGGSRFQEHFAPYIRKYGMTDMYRAGFHPFDTEEERWGYWAQHIGVNRHDPSALSLYGALLEWVSPKPYFVITTNVDHQFLKAGFPEDRVWAVQGDYGSFQFARGCHPVLYDNADAIRAMRARIEDCRIPSELVPVCPACGGPMDINIRKSSFFVEDGAWEMARDRYLRFLESARKGRILFLELGVGFNTPTIIRFPFEQMVHQFPGAHLLRLNARDCAGAPENRAKTLGFSEAMGGVLHRLLEASPMGGRRAL